MIYKVSCSNSCNVQVINNIPTHETTCYGNFEFIDKSKVYVKYQVWSLDVWGNGQ
jgi:hypothetical protein